MKIISCVLVASLSFSIGCYNNDTITREQLNPITKEELRAEVEQLDITVFTKESVRYKFLKGNYRVQSDTLIGFGVQTNGGDDRPFHGYVCFADITSLETEEFSLAKTLIAIGLPVGAAAAFLFSWAAGISKR
jgi:hypothetical protein